MRTGGAGKTWQWNGAVSSGIYEVRNYGGCGSEEEMIIRSIAGYKDILVAVSSRKHTSHCQ